MRRRRRRQPATVPLRTEEEWAAASSGRGDARRDVFSSLRASSPEGMVLSGMEQAALLRAIAGLPPHLRTALMLVDVEGMGYREVADRLAAPLNTVRSRVHRARRRLRCAFVPDCLRDRNAHPAGGAGEQRKQSIRRASG
jgi:RNA polymerase sigma-70 factor (ECF subfamily)